MGEAPYNAGQTFQIANVVAAPVSNIDCGTITVRENWGRLFIEQRGAEIMVLRSVYPDLRNVIDHFIEPTPDAAREADLRAIIGAYQDGTLPDLTAVHMGATLDARREIERLRGLLDEAQETRLRLDRRIHNQRARLHQLECALAHHLRSYYQAHIARVLGWDIPRLLRVKANARRATIAKIGGQND